LKRPQTVTVSEMLGLVCMIGGSVVMIPSIGVMGAAYAVLVQRAVSFLVLIVIGTMRLAQAGDGPLDE
jgi:Na+-driven multidrug efflux pump